jgi:hypothetical protein
MQGLLQLLTAPTTVSNAAIAILPATTETTAFHQLLHSATESAASLAQNLQTELEVASAALPGVPCLSAANVVSSVTLAQSDSKASAHSSKTATAENTGKTSTKEKSSGRNAKAEASSDNAVAASPSISAVALALPCPSVTPSPAVATLAADPSDNSSLAAGNNATEAEVQAGEVKSPAALVAAANEDKEVLAATSLSTSAPQIASASPASVDQSSQQAPRKTVTSSETQTLTASAECLAESTNKLSASDDATPSASNPATVSKPSGGKQSAGGKQRTCAEGSATTTHGAMQSTVEQTGSSSTTLNQGQHQQSNRDEKHSTAVTGITTVSTAAESSPAASSSAATSTYANQVTSAETPAASGVIAQHSPSVAEKSSRQAAGESSTAYEAVQTGQLRVGSSSSELKVSVQLPVIGRVDVRAVSTQQVTTAHVTAFRHDAVQALGAERGSLEQALRARDVVLGSLGSQTQGQGQNSPQQEDRRKTVHFQNNSDETQTAVPTTKTIISTPDHAGISLLA